MAKMQQRLKTAVHVGLLLLLLQPADNTMLSDLIPMEEYDPAADAAAPPGTVWHNGSYQYMPAPPGKSPPCARDGGGTICSQIPTYPADVIKRLLVNWKYDLSTVFLSETQDTLTSSPPQSPTRAPETGRTTRAQRTPFSGRAGQSTTEAPPSRRQRPIGFKATGRPASGEAGTLYTPPPARDHSRQGYSYRVPSKPVTWDYSYSIPRHKRQTDSEDGSQLCPTTGQFVTPKAGLNSRGEWRFVVNMEDLDPHYTQLVRTERCLSERCSGLCTIPSGMAAVCQQQFVQKKMVGLDPSGSQVYTDLYWIPHCCVCQIR